MLDTDDHRQTEFFRGPYKHMAPGSIPLVLFVSFLIFAHFLFIDRVVGEQSVQRGKRCVDVWRARLGGHSFSLDIFLSFLFPLLTSV